MIEKDRRRLTSALQGLVGRIATDLRVQLRDSVRERAQRLHADEKVGEDFDVWTDLLSRRAAVLWVLKSVYIRVLEDRGLLRPGRLLDAEAQQLFEALAPNLGDTAFLRWIYDDLGRDNGGLPELFARQPAELATPSDVLSRELIAFWRHKEPDTGFYWHFEDERFEGELMGDLYQELDPVVKDRFALCQTPDFVRGFILDRTLTPALEHWGDAVRLLDPACGSGHFLIDGLKRLVAHRRATRAQSGKAPTVPGSPDAIAEVQDALGRVVGIDLNDYACALARTRLVMTAAELAGVTTLAGAGRFHPHVYWADGLEQVEKEAIKKPQQLDLLRDVPEQHRVSLTRSDVRQALQPVLAAKFHAVVANPPYITEKDPARKDYHREKVGREQRYVSAYREYSLGSPFTERCFQLAQRDGFVGIITSNNFMKREFGKPLIERVLASVDLSLVVDTSQAYIPFHGTPTVLIFGRQRGPKNPTVRAVMGKRGESGTPADPAKGAVWSSIAAGWDSLGFENEYVSVSDLARTTLGRHPWSLGGGGAAELREALESRCEKRLSAVSGSIGFLAITGADEVFMHEASVLERHRVRHHLPMVTGDAVRDWSENFKEDTFWPYDDKAQPLDETDLQPELRFLWPYRTILRSRRVFSVPIEERGIAWWASREVYADRFATPLSIAFAEVATHNHFVLDRGGKVFKQTAPVIKLPAGATEDDHYALLGLLNSSTACFWMKQVCHPKTHAGQRHHPDPSRAVYAFSSSSLERLPVPELDGLRERVVALSRTVHSLATERHHLLSADGASPDGGAALLSVAIDKRWIQADVLRERMVGLQEELDWTSYVAYGLAADDCLVDSTEYPELTCPRGDRPFERLTERRSTVRAGGRALEVAEGEVAPVGELPQQFEAVWRHRMDAIRSSPLLAMVETPVFKRAWRDTQDNIAESEYRRRKNRDDLLGLLTAKMEHWASQRKGPFSLAHMVAGLQDDPSFLTVAEVLSGRRDFSLDALVEELLHDDAVASHPLHVYTPSGLAKRAAWEDVWALQRREDAGEALGPIPVPPEYSQGSRGKSTDFLRIEYYQLRGKLDVPKERFIAFTEVPGRSGADTLYGWAGWTPLQRLRALLALDESLEDAGAAVQDRIGVLDSAWRLLPDVAREDPVAASKLKPELQAVAGPTGPSPEALAAWHTKHPPPRARPARKAANKANGPSLE